MLKVMIVEDEQPTLEMMNMLVDQNKHLSVVGSFSNPIEALDQFPLLQPDVVFLDVEMPDMTGMRLAEKLIQTNENIQIVFTTAFEQYAVDAFKVNAVDYLVKFVTPEDIERVSARLIKNHEQLTKIKSLEESKGASIRCFGTFEIRGTDGSVIKWPTRKTEELFAYFLLHVNQVISKWRLMELFWPNHKHATTNLHTTISRMKKVLRDNQLPIQVEKVNEGYLFDLQNIECDLEAFKNYFSTNKKVAKENLAESEKTFRLYKGSLFELKDYIWSIGLERELAERYTYLTEQLVNYYVEKKMLEHAEETMKLYLTMYPLHEEMNVKLFKLYASRCGYKEQLKDHYTKYVKLLKEELDVEPSDEVKKYASFE
ncbi:response regulator [Chengkuizengella axinellae]|uniref:Response regulator n=1 Tax=Chengkuizengella axinellae TaxID=3064388 RepID=A0ABT9J0Z8_9BACL|nr:response regulator [Chengkuizengella sp. 2205SS18-9]MDP5275286.1 response regulator [Chengkuizengella sp. 2205SS18-9]